MTLTSSPLSSAQVLGDIIANYGEFYGCKLTNDRCEELALMRLDRKTLGQEAALMQTKWFCYRRLHFIKATYLFAEAYKRAFERCWKVNFDRWELAKTGLKPWSGADIFDLSEQRYMGFVRARQAADHFGVPYDTFCRYALQAVLDNGWMLKEASKHGSMPRPEYLRALTPIKVAVRTWELEECPAKLRFSPLRYYLLEHYVEAPDQDDHQTWLINQIKERPTPKYALAKVLYGRPMLFEERAVEVWGERTIQDARATTR